MEKDLVLKQDTTYSTRAFAGTTTGIPEECIEMDASNSSAFKLIDSRIIELNTRVKTNVYYQCFPGSYIGSNDCETFCIVSFEKDLSEG